MFAQTFNQKLLMPVDERVIDGSSTQIDSGYYSHSVPSI